MGLIDDDYICIRNFWGKILFVRSLPCTEYELILTCNIFDLQFLTVIEILSISTGMVSAYFYLFSSFLRKNRGFLIFSTASIQEIITKLGYSINTIWYKHHPQVPEHLPKNYTFISWVDKPLGIPSYGKCLSASCCHLQKRGRWKISSIFLSYFPKEFFYKKSEFQYGFGLVWSFHWNGIIKLCVFI